MNRWPPTVGMVGFDGGSKPAIALALPSRRVTLQGEATSGGGGPFPVIGACCYDDGSCIDLSEFVCASSGGTYQGDNTDCDPNPCPQPTDTGACCIDGVCSILSESDCTDGGGNYLGDDTTCVDVDCTNGVCCYCDGSCSDPPQTQEGCEADGGNFRGGVTACNPCHPFGACCKPTGDCEITSSELCVTGNGAYQGDCSTCEAVNCSHTGACCVDGVCSIKRRDDCTGQYRGDGTTCATAFCPVAPCCFLGCDDHWYYTRTTTGSGTFTQTFNPTGDSTFYNFDTVRIATCSGETVTCNCTGTQQIVPPVGDPLNFTPTCNCSTGEGGWWAQAGECCSAEAGGVEPENCVCPDCGTVTCSSIIFSDSCTLGTFTYDYESSATITFSGNCDAEMMSAPFTFESDPFFRNN